MKALLEDVSKKDCHANFLQYCRGWERSMVVAVGVHTAALGHPGVACMSSPGLWVAVHAL